jgi:hypothetical protein
MKTFKQFAEQVEYSNWTMPTTEDFRKEYHVEYEIKPLGKSGIWPTFEDFMKDVNAAEVIEVTRDIDSDISNRSRTKNFDGLHNLIKSYSSYPEFRNEKTLRGLYASFESGDTMHHPIVIERDGQRRVFAGNTRMDVAFQLGINPHVLLVKVGS